MPDSSVSQTVIPIEHGRHYDVIKSAIPPHLIDASPDQRAALRQTRPRTPDWYSNASQAQKDQLKASIQASVLSSKKLETYMGKIPALDDFAQPLLEQALQKAGFTLPVNQVFIRLYAPTTDAFGVGSGAFMVKTLSLLQAALHNFEQPETEAGYFANDSGFITEPDTLGRFEPYATDLTIATFASLCRRLDIGRLYQEELADYLFPDSHLSQRVLHGHYINHQKSVLEVDAQIALLKGDIDESAHDLMMRVVKGERQIMSGEHQLWYRYLCVMGFELKGCVVFDLCIKDHYSDAMIVWIPGDPEHPLKKYASFFDFRDELTRKLTARTSSLRQSELTPYQQFLSRFIRYKDRPDYYRRLTVLVKDAPEQPARFEWWLSLVPVGSLALRILPKPDVHKIRVVADAPDINVEICTMSGDRAWVDVEIWGKLFADMRGRRMTNARSMALPTEDADANSRSLRLSHYLNIGLFAVNLVAMGVPPLGDLMLVVMVGQLLYETVEGFIEWSEGDKEAAWAHINDVLENLVMMAAGAVVIHGVVSPVIEKLKAVTLPGGQQRLWNADLTPYEHPISLDPHSTPNEMGLHTYNNQQVLLHEGKPYVLEKDPVSDHYRALHPDNLQAYKPEFRHNGHGVWVHEGEEPLTWRRMTLMRRLGSSVAGLSDDQLEQILKASGIHENDLRRMYVENEPTPALLVESIHTFKAYTKAKTAVSQVRAGHLSDDLFGYCAAFTVELAGWPATKAIEIFDSRTPQATAVRFGSAQATDTDIIRISQADMIRGELPVRVVDGLSRDQLEVMLGEHVPYSRDERLQAFKEQLSALMEKNIQRLFKSLSAKSMSANDPLRAPIEWIKRVFPKLPTSIAHRLVAEASPAELALLKDGKGPARLMKAARRLQREARLSSAYLGLYMDDLVMPDTETLVLNTLEALPGWKNDLRIEVRDDHFRGELRASVGPSDAGRYKVLVRIADGKYEARDEQGLGLHGHDDLYSSLQHVLPDEHRASIRLPHVGQGSELQLSIQQHALPREQLLRLLNMRPESRPFFLPPERLLDGRLGYPLSGRSAGARSSAQGMLRDRFVRLYPLVEPRDIDAFFRVHGANASARIVALEDDLDELRTTLNRWEYTSASGSTYEQRVYISDCLESAWRKLSPLHIDDAGRYLGESLLIEGEGIGPLLESLPPLTSNFSHISRVELSDISATDAIDGFLSSFPNVRVLDLDHNNLTRLPASIANMPRLQALNLADNTITLTPESVSQLRGLTQMELLTLEGSPLGQSLDISRMPHLRAVFLRDCGLDRWPAGLFSHQRARGFTLALENNPLRQIPDVAPGSEEAGTLARTLLTREMLSEEVLAKLELYSDSVGIEWGREWPPGDERSSVLWVEHFTAEEAALKQALWSRVEYAKGSESFFNVITSQAELLGLRSSDFEQDMTAKLWRMLEAMDESEELRDRLFLIAKDPSCVDAGAQLFNTMGVEVLWHEAYQAPHESLVRLEVFDLAKGKVRLDELGRIAKARVHELEALGRKHPEYTDAGERVTHYDTNGVRLRDIDEVEIYLKYTTHLAKRLDLPWQLPEMYFPEEDVTQDMLDNACDRVLALEQGEGLCNLLLELPRWVEFVQGAYRSYGFDSVEARITALSDLEGAQQDWFHGKNLSQEKKAELRQKIELAAGVLGMPANEILPGQVISNAEYDEHLLRFSVEQQQLRKSVTNYLLGKIPRSELPGSQPKV